MEIEQPEDGRIKVKRELEAGWFQWITLPLPAVLTIQSGRRPGIRRHRQVHPARP
jgi:electron transfer flavoprotein alpha/beta subunit